METVLIVGASTAGIRTAQSLRNGGWPGRIVVAGDESHTPYEKPPLSKAPSVEGDPPGAAFSEPVLPVELYEQLGIELRLASRANGLDLANSTVEFAGGHSEPFTHLVIATGLVPRTLGIARGHENVFTIRTIDDRLRLEHELRRARRALVIGAGFVGAEFASIARSRGVEVDMVEAQDVPLASLLGHEVGQELASMQAAHGVRIHCGVTVARFVGEGRFFAAELSDGRTLPADFAVVGIGADPATGWLASSGLLLNDGVECDAQLHALDTAGHPLERVFAAGDVARRPHPYFDKPVRIEHWSNANEHAALVASEILGTAPPRPQLPYVWSDQYGSTIQIVGTTSGTARILRAGGPGGVVAVYTNDDDAVVGGIAVDDPRALMAIRKAVTRGRSFTELDVVGATAS